MVWQQAREAVEAMTAEDPDAESAFRGYVYSMWQEHSFAFSQVAYRNTETLLALLPNAQYRFFEFVPVESRGYRIADALSRTHFDRYAKRGYDMRLRMVNARWGPYVAAKPQDRREVPEKTNVGEDRAYDERPGSRWWAGHRRRFPYLLRSNWRDLDSVKPHPRDAFFIAVVHLYLTGGLFTDHTVALRNVNVTAPAQVALHGDGDGGACAGISAFDKETGETADTSKLRGWDRALPMLLIFPEEGHAILDCVLQKYDAVGTRGVEAQQTLDEYCLSPASSASSASPAWPASPSFYGEDPGRGEAQAAAREDDLATLRIGQGGCARHLLESCATSTRTEMRHIPLAWGSCDADSRGSRGPDTPERGPSLVKPASSLGMDVDAFDGVWTGPASQGLAWDEPDPDAFASRYVYAKRTATRWAPPALRTALHAQAMRNVLRNVDADAFVANSSRDFSDAGLPSCAARLPRCHPFFSVMSEPGARSGRRSLAGIASRDLPPNSRKNIAEAKCSPAVVIAGVEKGATTYLFSLLAQHPQVLPPLRGAGFKETGAYLEPLSGPSNFWEKVHRFPYIREGEPFVTGDASVQNMMDKGAPERLQQDQPNPRIIFSLREPVDRAWSGYRFAFSYYKTQLPRLRFPNLVSRSTAFFDNCFATATRSDGSEDAAVNGYYRCIQRFDMHHTVWKGLYYYPVLHWMRILGRDNVMVIAYEDLVADPQKVLGDVLDFVGLCTEGLDLEEIIASATANATPKDRVDEIGDHGRTNATTAELREFYRPHNEKLFQLLGRRLPWRDT